MSEFIGMKCVYKGYSRNIYPDGNRKYIITFWNGNESARLETEDVHEYNKYKKGQTYHIIYKSS